VSEEQLEELRNLGVELVQGPIVGEPIPLSELTHERGMWGPAGVKRWSPDADEENREVASPSTSTPGGGTS
jgi:hypothetical protein